MISALILALLCSFVLRLRAKFGCFFFSSVCSRESGQECLCEVLLLFFEFLYLCVRVGHPQNWRKECATVPPPPCHWVVWGSVCRMMRVQFDSRMKSFFVHALNPSIRILWRCNLRHTFTENLRLSEVGNKSCLVVMFAFLEIFQFGRRCKMHFPGWKQTSYLNFLVKRKIPEQTVIQSWIF